MSDVETVERVRVALSETFEGVDVMLRSPCEHLQRRPEYEGAWSILEHLEHVSLANHYLLLTIKKGCRTALKRAAGAAVPEGESELEKLAPVAVPGAFDWPPPRHMIPTGERDPVQLRGEFQVQREECLSLLAAMTAGEGRLYSIRMSVNKLGRLDMYQWLYFLAQHMRYHLTLMERI